MPNVRDEISFELAPAGASLAGISIHLLVSVLVTLVEVEVVQVPVQ